MNVIMNDFYKRIISFCNQRNISVYRMCKDVGINPSVISDIKAGRRQGVSSATAEKMAKYFSVSLSYFLGYEDNPCDNDEYALYLEAIKNREEIRNLFDVANGASKAEIEKAVKIIEIIKN